MALGRDKQQISHSSVGFIVFFFACSGFFLKGEMTLMQELNLTLVFFSYLGLHKHCLLVITVQPLHQTLLVPLEMVQQDSHLVEFVAL